MILKCFVVLLLFVCTIHIATCIKCFNCNSRYDPNCADPFDNRTVLIVDCDLKRGLFPGRNSSSKCGKIRQKVNGEWHYSRDCSVEYISDGGIDGNMRQCITRAETNNLFIEVCTCNDKDACNSSTQFAPKPLLILFTFVSLIYKMS